ncbi:unnamed protein product [Rotaria magnacalcarata]|uniref:Resistance to inhibitors of cholinesterase protein 3 N-terminal domain-containing protein n=1 Tax=Rotaria magnacalcarata TaxID=392030 RepID=A0A8S2KYB7_9BILA|nr:unnamed protein product [Rotaria magnacalcarata]
MSLFARPNILLAVLFGCCAVLIPRIILPLFRPRSPSPNPHMNEYVERVQSTTPQSDHNEDSSPDNHDEFLNMRIPNHGSNIPEHSSIEEHNLKSNSTFALPMYTVGIGVFLVYTCCKYWGSRNSKEKKIRNQYSANNIHWNSEKRKFKYEVNHDCSDNEQENEDSYAGLDPDYVEYLKARRHKEFEVEQKATTEQKEMYHALDEMKHSLSFINSKLGTDRTRKKLTQHEVSQLQDRLTSTEAQMYQIFNTINTVSNKVHELTGIAQNSVEQSEPEEVSDEEEDNDDESEVSSERYGIMETNYGSDHGEVDDYEIEKTNRPEPPTTDSRTKVQEWHQRNHSQSLSSSNASLEEDQSLPNEGENTLRRRKCQ